MHNVVHLIKTTKKSCKSAFVHITDDFIDVGIYLHPSNGNGTFWKGTMGLKANDPDWEAWRNFVAKDPNPYASELRVISFFEEQGFSPATEERLKVLQ